MPKWKLIWTAWRGDSKFATKILQLPPPFSILGLHRYLHNFQSQFLHYFPLTKSYPSSLHTFSWLGCHIIEMEWTKQNSNRPSVMTLCSVQISETDEAQQPSNPKCTIPLSQSFRLKPLCIYVDNKARSWRLLMPTALSCNLRPWYKSPGRTRTYDQQSLRHARKGSQILETMSADTVNTNSNLYGTDKNIDSSDINCT